MGVDREISRGLMRQRDSDDGSSLAGDSQGAVTPHHPEIFDVGSQRFGDPQAVQRQQARQVMVTPAGEPAWTRNIPTSFLSSSV